MNFSDGFVFFVKTFPYFLKIDIFSVLLKTEFIFENS